MSAPDRTLGRIEWSAGLLALAAAVLGSCLVAAHGGALWRDEVNSVNTALAPSFAEFARDAEFDSFPLLWLSLLRAWLALAGAGDVGLRCFGLLGGLALFAALTFAALRLGRRPALLGMALLAVNPAILVSASALRAWGLGAALGILALVLVFEATRAPSPRRIALAALFAVLGVQCVFQNPVLLAALCGGAMASALFAGHPRRALVPLGIGAVAALSLLPYLPLFLRVGEWRALAHVPLSLLDLAGRAFAVFTASGPLVLATWGAFFVLALAAGVACVRDRQAESERRALVLGALVTVVCASAGLLVFLKLVGHPTEPWYFLGAVALLAACGEIALARSTDARAPRLAVAALTVLVLAFGLPRVLGTLRQPQTNVDAIARELEANASPRDLVIVNPWVYAISFARYYDGRAPFTTIPPLPDHRLHRYDRVREIMQREDPTAPLRARVEAVLQSGGRVWIVGGLSAPPPGQAPPRLPPPPLPDTGWNAEPYETAWSMELSALLRRHATRARDVATPPAREFAYLRVFEGWR